MKKRVSIVMFALMAVFGASLFADAGKVVVGLNPVKDSVRTADSERAIMRLDSQISAALLKIKKFTVAKKEGKEELKDIDYLLDMSVVEYYEEAVNVKKSMLKTAKYTIEMKLVNVKNGHIIIQDSIKGKYESAKIPVGAMLPDISSDAMMSVSEQVADKITSELFPVSVLKVSEGGVITIANYGFNVGDVLNVVKFDAMVDPNTGEEVAKEETMICPIIVLEVSGSTARCVIHTLKPYKKQYAKAVVEVGMMCKRAMDKPIDMKSLSPLLKQLKKLK